jgi:hypothetical protein
LIRVTYDVIAELAGGITGDTARRYAQRGLFDARDLASVLRWVNGVRRQQGLSLIGVGEAVPADEDPGPVSSTPTLSETVGILRYNPRRACFEEDNT